MTMSGSGYNTNPEDVYWFCHVCGWAGTLKAGHSHACEPDTSPAECHAVGRFGWLLYRLGVKGLPGLWRLSGYARPGLDVDHVCQRCYSAWSAGDWFWRWCRKCAAISEVTDA